MVDYYKDLESFLLKNNLFSSEIKNTIEIIRKNPDDHIQKEFWDLAIKELEVYVERCPDEADGHAQLGYAYFKKGLIDKAITQFEHALKINPNDYSTRHDLGVALSEKSKRDGGC